METGKRIKDIRGLNSNNDVQDSHEYIKILIFIGIDGAEGKILGRCLALGENVEESRFSYIRYPDYAHF